MSYSPDISGFPYWPTEAQEKREEVWEKGWEQGKCDQMDHDDNRDDAIKKLKKEKKNIKGEKKYLAKKVPKMREEIKVIKDRLHWKDKEIKAYEKGAQNSGQIAIAQGEKIKELKEQIKPMSREIVRDLVGEYFRGERVSRNPEVSTSYTIYDWDSEEDTDDEDTDEEEEN